MGLTKFWSSLAPTKTATSPTSTAKPKKPSPLRALTKWTDLVATLRRHTHPKFQLSTKPSSTAVATSSSLSKPTSDRALCPSLVPLDSLARPVPLWISPAVVALEQSLATSTVSLAMTSDGCGGAYFVNTESSRHPVGIFKPRDEEYMAPKNPRGYVKEGAIVGVTEHPTNKGFVIGNGALRERAAYLLDEAYGSFSGVPVTSLVSLDVNGILKEGSVQAFVTSESSAEDMGSRRFSIPEVHKIGILDLRLFNTDRHAGNILLQSNGPHVETFAMTPIDHGFCLPAYQHLDGALMDWMQWPQSEYPFTSEELEHIASLNVEKDANILRAVGIQEECVTTMRICTTLLQLGAEAGFSLHEIGKFLQREGDFSQPAPLEIVVNEAIAKVKEDTLVKQDSTEFMDAVVDRAVDAIQQILKEQPKKKVRSISCFS